MDVRVGLWRKLSTEELMLLNYGVGEDSWESLGLQGDPTSLFWRRSALGFLWKEWCWSWNSSTLATSCEELTHWKRPWCWERLRAGGEGDDRGWGAWMASPTQWTSVWVDSGSWWWTGRPGVLQLTGSQRVGHDSVTELKDSLEKFWNYLAKLLLVLLTYIFVICCSPCIYRLDNFPTQLQVSIKSFHLSIHSLIHQFIKYIYTDTHTYTHTFTHTK